MTTGRFVWHELMTNDVAAAQEFYSKLFGWTVQDTEMGPLGTYHMLLAGEDTIGGICALESGQEAPPHWVAYVTVDDVDATMDRAKGLGAAAHVPPTDIPEVGRFSMIGDPHGGVICPFAGAGDPGPEPEGMPPPGRFCWNEYLTPDPDAAKVFYGEVFGWTTKDVDMGPLGTYHVLGNGDKDCGGIMKMPPGVDAPAHWLGYIAVEDVDAVAAKIGELGGTVCVGPQDIPGVGRFAVANDPTGAVFALYKGM